ncbi:MAG: S9 family peptidase [Candidatus Dormibacteraeota bacterium]|nr:S9 family peptidase [Candidatus Dormibacteraeota bacterium]
MANPLSPEDLYRFRWIDHPRVAPAGDVVAYSLSWADAEAVENRGSVLVQGLMPGAEALPLPGTGRRDSAPEWSPDGRRLAFLGRVGPRDQVHVHTLGESDSRRLTLLPDGVSDVRWSPDGRHLGFLAAVPSDPDGVVEDPRPPDSAEQVRRPPVARVVRSLDYKHDGSGYTDGRRPHLFTIPVDGGEPRQLTSGPWSILGFSWAPDSASLAVVGDAEPGAERRRESHLHVVTLDGERRRLVGGMDISAPAWSPDGQTIAFLAPRGDAAGLHERVWTVPVAGGEPVCLTADFDHACDGGVVSDMRSGHVARIQWSADGSRLFFLASGPGSAELCSVGLDGGARREVAGDRRVIFDFDVAGRERVVCVADPARPGDMVLAGPDGERSLTDCNAWLSQRRLAVPERLDLTAPDGLPLEGWLLAPGGGGQGRHPLILQVHGGPHGQYGWTFFHEFQILAGAGFYVLYLNPRGSDGYGEAFKQACVRDWGGADYRDLMAALDQTLERHPDVDPGRLGVAGGSYGGYMTNWIVGQTDRFQAAVAMRSICNLVSEYAQDDIAPWFEQELGEPGWLQPDRLWERSPLRHVESIRTPLLLLHSEMDLRCPISQAEELFGALRMLGREVEMVRFPGESHELSRSGRPDRRVERLRRIADWFEHHIGARDDHLSAGSSPPPSGP